MYRFYIRNVYLINERLIKLKINWKIIIITV